MASECQVMTDNMTSDTVPRYPFNFSMIKVNVPPERYFKYNRAYEFINELSTYVSCDVHYNCKQLSDGMLFFTLELELGEHCINPYGSYAEYLIASMVQYEPDIWKWIDSNVMLRMVEAVALFRLERVFARMIKYNPLLVLGERIIYVFFKYGTYKMMEMILDLCELDLIDLMDADNVPEDVVEIELCEPNPMNSEGSHLFLKRFGCIKEYEKEYGFAVVGLKVKKEVLLRYGPDLDEFVQSRKRQKRTYYQENTKQENTKTKSKCIII